MRGRSSGESLMQALQHDGAPYRKSGSELDHEFEAIFAGGLRWIGRKDRPSACQAPALDGPATVPTEVLAPSAGDIAAAPVTSQPEASVDDMLRQLEAGRCSRAARVSRVAESADEGAQEGDEATMQRIQVKLNQVRRRSMSMAF